jgi:ABC-type maltose transport system permease subunit
VLSVLGYVPGIIAIVVVALIITWSDYVVGAFKLKHPQVYTVAE